MTTELSTAPTIAVTNPATGEKVREVPALDREATLDLVRRSRAAQPAWEAAGFKERARLMREMRKWMVRNRARVRTEDGSLALDRDEHPRAGTNLESLAKLTPSFEQMGAMAPPNDTRTHDEICRDVYPQITHVELDVFHVRIRSFAIHL